MSVYVGNTTSNTIITFSTITQGGVKGQIIPTGTTITFQQTTAPTGFTKVTTYNDYAMRIVSGSVANKTNGVAFTTAFASQTPSGSVSTSVSGSVGSTTLSISQIPGHYHDVTISSFAGDLGFVASNGGGDGGWYDFQDNFCDDPYHYNPTGSGVSAAYARATGGGGSHNHTWSGSASSSFTGSAINMAVNYVDFILATAN